MQATYSYFIKSGTYCKTPQPYRLLVIEFEEDAVEIQDIDEDDDTLNAGHPLESSKRSYAHASEGKKPWTG